MIAWIPFYQAVIYFYQILDIVQNHNFFTFFKMQYKIKKKNSNASKMSIKIKSVN